MNLCGSCLRLIRAVIAAGIVLHATAASAADPKAFVCSFDTGTFSAYEGSKFQKRPADDRLSLSFAALDFAKGTAQMIGNAGVADITILGGQYSSHLLEMTPVGNLNTTTIYTTPNATGRYPAVHSRHVGTSDSPMVSQYLGECEGRW